MRDWTLIEGDCLAHLRGMEDQSVDIVVTSPPYNQLGKRIPPSAAQGMYEGNGWIHKVNRVGYEEWENEDAYQSWLVDVIGQCLRVSRGLVWINHKTRYRNRVGLIPHRIVPFPIYSEIVWDRGGSMVLNARKFAPSHEYIIGFGAPHYWDQSCTRLMSVWRIGAARNNPDHPCPFPLEIPRRLIKASCPRGGTVLDPFAGICTTGIAADQLDRHFMGIEQNPTYIEAAQRRRNTGEKDVTTLV